MDSANVVLDANRDVVVAGAGIIGLSVALELAAAGLRVTVIERATSMAESSWAAAGMLAANDPENPAPMAELAALSLSLYPGYLAGIEQLSGRQIPFRTHVALQGTRMGKDFDSGYEYGRVVSQSEAQEIVPGMVTAGRTFRLLDEHSLDPRDLCVAVPVAARADGVNIFENTSVIAVSDIGGRRVKIGTSRGTISAGHFINCAGAWSADLMPSRSKAYVGRTAAKEASATMPVEPRKGQMLVVRLDQSEALRCVIRTPDIYLVPRGDGRLVIGATVEDAGFDKLVDPNAISSLLSRAAELWPPLSSASIVDCWAGLRPWSPDGMPIISSVGGAVGSTQQWVATGHFRNGILLAPATAKIVSQLVQGLASGIDITPFSMHRFAPASALSDNATCCAL